MLSVYLSVYISLLLITLWLLANAARNYTLERKNTPAPASGAEIGTALAQAGAINADHIANQFIGKLEIPIRAIRAD
jgi:hypothetical protein